MSHPRRFSFAGAIPDKNLRTQPSRVPLKHPSVTRACMMTEEVLQQSSPKSKGVSFGPALSPEQFDEGLPPSTPLKKGGIPVTILTTPKFASNTKPTQASDSESYVLLNALSDVRSVSPPVAAAGTPVEYRQLFLCLRHRIQIYLIHLLNPQHPVHLQCRKSLVVIRPRFLQQLRCIHPRKIS
ncbi:unnamed protein product [Dicrocoelium dendriticum]|nr:unnamed protein product [Dicrocoelium dendriticum]